MSDTSKRILLTCLVIGAAFCLCLSVISIGASGILLLQPGNPVALITPERTQPTHIPSPTPAPPGASTPTLPQETSPAATETPGVTPNENRDEADLPADIAQQMDQIQEQVIELRKLESKGPVTRRLLTLEELGRHVRENFLKDYTTEEAQNDSIILAAFGLAEPGFDFRTFYIDLLSEQVAGYYDDEDKAMYVVQGAGFQGPERLTYSHEYVHALQDQNYDFKNGLEYNDESCDADSERCAAIQALIEGDATVLEFQWFNTYSTSQDVREIQEFYNNYKSPVYDQAPAFMREDFVFPYRAGQAFVEYLLKKGGWEAVDAAYRDLPVSTEQILHPERYPDDRPVPFNLPNLEAVLGEGWRELDRNVMGEWYTYLILAHGLEPAHRLSDTLASEAAEGWGGDTYVVYYNDATQATAMVLATVWDSVAEARQFASAFRRYATARFGDPSASQNSFSAWDTPQGTHTFRLDTDKTFWILASDSAQAEATWQAIASHGN